MTIILGISDLLEGVNKKAEDLTLSDFREEFLSSFRVADVVIFEKGKKTFILKDRNRQGASYEK